MLEDPRPQWERRIPIILGVVLLVVIGGAGFAIFAPKFAHHDEPSIVTAALYALK